MAIEMLPTEYRCPCRSGRPFSDCCRPFLGGLRDAPTAEALVRSRFSAYVRQDQMYLLYSWHPDTRPLSLAQPADRQYLDFKMLRVQYDASMQGCVVETVAQYRDGSSAELVHEISYLVQQDDQWFFVYSDIEHWDRIRHAMAR